MQTRRFGGTNHPSTVAIFGAAALWSATQAEADAIMEQVIAAGVNHISGLAGHDNYVLHTEIVVDAPFGEPQQTHDDQDRGSDEHRFVPAALVGEQRGRKGAHMIDRTADTD